MIKVLIAEDEIPLLRGIKTMIEKLNPEFSVVMCAHNGKEAITYLKSNRVDVIFTDINMPLADGIEVMDYANEKYQKNYDYPEEWFDETDKIDKWISDNEVYLYKWMYDLILNHKSEVLKFGEI